MQWIRKIYLYLVSLVALIILVVAAINLINLGLKTWVFTKADQDFMPPKMVCFPSEGDFEPDCTEQEYSEEELRQQREQRSARRQREASRSIAMLLVAAPVFFFHFRLAQKEK